MKNSIWRALVKVGFIVFPFYSNLLTGECERPGMGEKHRLIDEFAGYLVFEFL